MVEVHSVNTTDINNLVKNVVVHNGVYTEKLNNIVKYVMVNIYAKTNGVKQLEIPNMKGFALRVL